jgi:hypothetical protein
MFEDFLSIPELPITVASAPFLEFFTLLPSSDPFAGKRSVLFHPLSLLFRTKYPNLRRAYFSTVSVLQYSAPLLDAIVNETFVSNNIFPLFLFSDQPMPPPLSYNHQS